MTTLKKEAQIPHLDELTFQMMENNRAVPHSTTNRTSSTLKLGGGGSSVEP